MLAQPVARRWSLTMRLGWRLAAVMLVAILLAGAAVAWRAVKTVHDLDDQALQSQARLIAKRLPERVDTAGMLTLPPDLVAPFRASDGDNLFLVFDRTGGVVSSDPEAAALLAPVLPDPGRHGFFRIPPSTPHPHGMVGLLIPAGPWRVMVLQGREQSRVLLDSLMGNFFAAALWLLLPLGVAMVLVGVVTLRRGLRPMRDVSEAAALVGPSQPGARLPGDALPVEVAPLVHAVNEALARMEAAVEAQRRFVVEAAHGLRTPLAVLTARLDMLEEQPEVTALRADADRMARLVGQLLRIARLEAVPLDVTREVDLHAVALEAITSLVPLALRRNLELALHEEAGLPVIRGNDAALVVAMTNLIENALAYAPLASLVEVAITAPGKPGSVTIAVLDRGPGVAAEDCARIFGRFERGATPREGGAGLGLAIVAGIATAHGGAVQVTAREGGGATFSLTLG